MIRERVTCEDASAFDQGVVGGIVHVHLFLFIRLLSVSSKSYSLVQWLILHLNCKYINNCVERPITKLFSLKNSPTLAKMRTKKMDFIFSYLIDLKLVVVVVKYYLLNAGESNARMPCNIIFYKINRFVYVKALKSILNQSKI